MSQTRSVAIDDQLLRGLARALYKVQLRQPRIRVGLGVVVLGVALVALATWDVALVVGGVAVVALFALVIMPRNAKTTVRRLFPIGETVTLRFEDHSISLSTSQAQSTVDLAHFSDCWVSPQGTFFTAQGLGGISVVPHVLDEEAVAIVRQVLPTKRL